MTPWKDALMMNIGIDPGKSGGIAVLGLHGDVKGVTKLDATEKEIVDWLRDAIKWMSAHAYLERVASRPGQGVASTFKFGQSYGYLRGVLTTMGIPFEEVTPAKWQRAMGCLSKGDKNVTKQKAGQLFPDQKVAHWNADALLIAEFGRRVRSGMA